MAAICWASRSQSELYAVRDCDQETERMCNSEVRSLRENISVVSDGHYLGFNLIILVVLQARHPMCSAGGPPLAELKTT